MTEAISRDIENNEIAMLPLVARNEKQGVPHRLSREKEKQLSWFEVPSGHRAL